MMVLDYGELIADGAPAAVAADPARDRRLSREREARAAVRDVSADARGAGSAAGYGAQPVLSDVSLDVGARALVVLVGANGAGKSTLLGAIAGLVPAPARSASTAPT